MLMSLRTAQTVPSSCATAAGVEPNDGARLWRRWVTANVAGEVVGFGLAAAVGVILAKFFQPAQGFQQALGFVFTVIIVGAVEGSAVGLAQSLALAGAFRRITRPSWVAATVAGAICAWVVGMLIGTRLGEGAALPQTPLTLAVVAIGIGGIAGVLLSAFQWLVLRRAAEGAGWWVPAHAGAWALGMVVAFAGTSLIQDETPIALVAFVGATTGVAMGALVAALTGVVLVRALRPRSSVLDGDATCACSSRHAQPLALEFDLWRARAASVPPSRASCRSLRPEAS
jgi:hypothetical protein